MFLFNFNRSACAVAVLLAVSAAGQNFDNSANARLKGSYFVREVLVTNVNAQGAVGQALSAVGTMIFDGAGDYTFTGTMMNSNPAQQNTSYSVAGNYQLAANGFLWIDSTVGTYTDSSGNAEPDVAYGGVGAAGPNAFVASTTENVNYDLLIGIPLAATTNSSFTGAWNAAYLDFSSADVTKVRDATLALTADGKGNLGSVAVSGYAANQNSTILSQTASGATYSLPGVTATGGAINFGSSATLVGGSMSFMVSPDGKLFVGGSPNDFDMLVGTTAVANANAAIYQGFYFLGGLEDDASELAAESQSTVDAFYGSSSVTGSGGISINHLRVNPLGVYPHDYTYNDNYTVPATGGFEPSNEPDQFMLGANGQVVIASGVGTWYSVMVGLQVANPTGTGVFLNPLGIVNAGNFAPATNPVAPLEMVLLFGNGIATSDWDATTFPLPTATPDGVEVLINGSPVPLLRTRASLNPNLIYAVVPSAIGPASGVYYATFEVANKNGKSQPVTMYTNYTAPGLFAISEGGVGNGALHANGSWVTAADPANVTETVLLFTTGLGGVTPAVPDGTLPTSSTLNATPTVYISTWNSVLPYAGPAPCCVGLDQVNLTVPPVATADWYLDVWALDPVGLDGGESYEATINVAGGAAAGAVPMARRPLRALGHGVSRTSARKPVSGRLPHTGSDVTQ